MSIPPSSPDPYSPASTPPAASRPPDLDQRTMDAAVEALQPKPKKCRRSISLGSNPDHGSAPPPLVLARVHSYSDPASSQADEAPLFLPPRRSPRPDFFEPLFIRRPIHHRPPLRWVPAIATWDETTPLSELTFEQETMLNRIRDLLIDMSTRDRFFNFGLENLGLFPDGTLQFVNQTEIPRSDEATMRMLRSYHGSKEINHFLLCSFHEP
jgi:hypothetical protein